MKQKVNFAEIRTFIALADSNSFTETAERLGITRSHVSKQLTQLENSLGVSLMTRTTRKQQLTQAGKLFYQQCQQGFHVIEQAIDELSDNANQLTGTLKINAVGGFLGEYVIAPLVIAFMQQYPHIQVELDFSSQRVNLVSGEFDFVFRMGNLDDSELIARHLVNLPVNVYASPAYLSHWQHTQGTMLTHPKQLAQMRCISGSLKHWQLILGEQKVDIHIEDYLHCKNGQVMLHAAKAGLGVIRIPSCYCQNELTQGELIPVFQDWQVQATSLYLLYLKDRYQTKRQQVFKDFVMTHFHAYFAQATAQQASSKACQVAY